MATPFPSLTVVDHPLVACDLACLRSATTPSPDVRRLVARIATVLVVEASRRFPTREVPVETPLEATVGRALAGPVTLVPILRAGLGMLDAALALLPEARVGHLGIYRKEDTREPVSYYRRIPPGASEGPVLVLDPMLATGGTAVAALDVLKGAGCRDLTLLAVVAAPEGVRRVAERHPDVPMLVAALDRCLDARAFIRPGLGDAGDRIFGTL